jgi:hypothetical protein
LSEITRVQLRIQITTPYPPSSLPPRFLLLFLLPGHAFHTNLLSICLLPVHRLTIMKITPLQRIRIQY